MAGEYLDVEYVKIKLYGFCRHFAQRGTYRQGENGENCVATVSPCDDSWVSAVLITGLTDDEYKSYIEREKGYQIREVLPEHISFYDDVWALHQFDEILLPIGTMSMKEVKPVPSYVSKCVTGAFKHGDKFGSDFVLTTQLDI